MSLWILCVSSVVLVCDAVTYSQISAGLTSVPDTIPPDADTINLKQNQISYISQGDFNNKFPDLSVIDLSSNDITGIDDGCFRGTILEKISTGYNKLTKFPDFSQVKDTLQRIGMNFNSITSVSTGEVEYLTRLQILTLRSNPLVHITEHLRIIESLVLIDVQLICCRNLTWIKEMGSNATTTGAECASGDWTLSGRAWSSLSKAELQSEPCRTPDEIGEHPIPIKREQIQVYG
jgi:hypothetical protein